MTSTDSSSPIPPHGDVGTRFRRPLTEQELDKIAEIAKWPGETGGLAATFRAIWDVLLGEAEGVTYAEASERGLKFNVAEYAIPESQRGVLLDLLHEVRGPAVKESSVAMLWLDRGPATYPDGSAP